MRSKNIFIANGFPTVSKFPKGSPKLIPRWTQPCPTMVVKLIIKCSPTVQQMPEKSSKHVKFNVPALSQTCFKIHQYCFKCIQKLSEKGSQIIV